jgi:ferritin-like metal-binding protein YciE
VRETDEQIKRLELCLERVGDSPSTPKNLATGTAAAFQGALHGMLSDEVIKDTLTGFAVEHSEIAYRHDREVDGSAHGPSRTEVHAAHER